MADDEIHIHLDAGVEESAREYRKLAAILFGILGLALILGWARGFSLERFLGDFMAVFFITFAAFKFANLENFAITYRGYDVIARRFPAWAFMYPFIEGGLGVAYLMLDDSMDLNVVTLLLTGIAAIGVIKELSNKSNIMCACLGTIIRLPLSKVSLVEDVAMFAMAATMLLI